MQTVLFARQPIVDTQLRVQGYELLFRGAGYHEQNFDGDQASSQVLLNALANQDLHLLLGGKPAFINCTKNLLQWLPDFLQTEIVIELLEDLIIDDALLLQLADLKAKGHRVALDDFVPNSDQERLLPMADIVKLDVRALGLAGVKATCARLARQPLTLLAEKVESEAEYQACLSYGCTLFQGFFHSQPELVHGPSLSSDQQLALQLLADLGNPEVSVHQIHNMVAADPSISYHIMKVINSSYFKRSQTVDSLQQAIVLLGLDNLKGLVSLFVFERLGATNPMLQHLSLMRANMAMLLAKKHDHQLGAAAFTLGILSCLEYCTNQPTEQLIQHLNIRADVLAGLFHQQGPLGQIHQLVLAHENLDEQPINKKFLDDLNLSTEQFNQLYIQAIRHTDLVLEHMQPAQVA